MKGSRLLMVLAGFTITYTSISCKKEITKSEKYLEVMKIHDIAMAEMGNIHHKSKELKEKLGSSISSEDSLIYFTALKELEKAEDGMMEWMAGFKLPKEYNEANAFLESEMTKVQKVNNDIFAALEKSGNILKSKSENK
jgi:hypothetical protein